jgi:hypothetical protein
VKRKTRVFERENSGIEKILGQPFGTFVVGKWERMNHAESMLVTALGLLCYLFTGLIVRLKKIWPSKMHKPISFRLINFFKHGV